MGGYQCDGYPCNEDQPYSYFQLILIFQRDFAPGQTGLEGPKVEYSSFRLGASG
jgi:hypothetical protein